MSIRFTCVFCDKDFSTNKILKEHQRKAQYCLKKQARQNVVPKNRQPTREEFVRLVESTKITEKELSGTRKQLEDTRVELESTKKLLEDSRKEVFSLKEELNSSLREANCRLEAMLREQISRPTSSTIVNGNLQTTNRITNGIENFTQMMAPITDNHLQDQARFLQREHIEQGVEGYARYALEYPLKDRVVCTDFSRRKLQYRNDKGHVIQDPEMRKLSQELFKAIEDRNETLINEYTRELMDMMKYDDSPVLVDIMSDMCALRREVHKMARGEKSDISKTFIKDICSRATNVNEIKQLPGIEPLVDTDES